MSDLSHKFNIVWAGMAGTKNANAMRVFLEVRRRLTGQDTELDRLRDFTVWELRLAEIVVERMQSGPTLP